MLFAGTDRDELRGVWLTAWRRYRAGEVLEPLQAQLVGLIERHPEYHAILEAGEALAGRDWTPESGESNPFLHLGLHLAVRDAVATDRPPGIRAVYDRLLARAGDDHAAEHELLDALGATLWEAQRSQRPPDAAAWLERARARSGAK